MRIALVVVLLAGCTAHMATGPTPSGPPALCDPAHIVAGMQPIDLNCAQQNGPDTRGYLPSRMWLWETSQDGTCALTFTPDDFAYVSCDAHTDLWTDVHAYVVVQCVAIEGLDTATGMPTSATCASLFSRCQAACTLHVTCSCTFNGIDPATATLSRI